jgi:hypothetical protein
VQKVLRAKSSFKRQSGELPAGDVTAHQSIAANSTGSKIDGSSSGLLTCAEMAHPRRLCRIGSHQVAQLLRHRL